MPTLKDVADRAKVSITTASLVLNGKGDVHRIATETTKKVLAVAKELQYRGNYHARPYRKGCSGVFGFATSNYSQQASGAAFWNHLMKGIQAGAFKNERDLLVICGNEFDDTIEKAERYYMEHRVDAIIAAGYYGAMFTTPPRIPLVLVPDPSVAVAPAVRLDQTPGINAAVDHLAMLGHKRVLWIVDKQFAHGRLRARIIEDTAEERGLSMSCLCFDIDDEIGQSASPLAEDYYKTIYRHTMAHIREIVEHTAIFCYNDATAVGVLAALRDAGVRVPEDMSVIGFDNLESKTLMPRLATINYNLDDMGEAAVRLAMRISNERDFDIGDWKNSAEMLPSTFIPGETIAAARSGTIALR